MRLKDIPPELYPFLLGPREANLQNLMGPHAQDVNVAIPTYHTWQSAPPPSAQPGQPLPFVAQPDLPIRISGDRRAAQEVRERIERQAALLRQQLTSHQVPIERGRHQFIVGQDGDALHDLVAETGCSVIVPPSHDDSETLYIIGPPDRIDSAINKVLDTAASMNVSNIDVGRQHARAPAAHAHNVSRYLKEREALADLERQYASSFVLPTSTNSPANWQIFSKDGKQGMRARTEAMNLLAGHPPSRFQAMEVNPFYHQHLQTRAPQIRRDHGVHLLFPPIENPDTHEILLVYEQPGSPSDYQFPRQAPTAADVQEHERAIKQAYALLTGMVGNRGEVVQRPVEAPPKFHDKIQRFVDREHRGLDESQIPPQIFFSASNGSKAFHVRGLANDVGGVHARIQAFVEQEKKDELERGYTTSFEYPHKIANHLIGRKGDSIKRLQDEFDVEINYTEGKVELKGPQAKCEACKAHILSMVKKLGDETTHSVKIAPKYHGDLKGQKGSQVLRLQERYNVRINFPRQIATPGDDVDGATEASFRNQPNQPPDVVTIRGPKKGADEARDELLNLLQYAVDNSHTATISVAAKQIPSLIGSGGRELESLRMETGCYVDVPKRESGADPSERMEVKLKGTKQAVDAAKKILLEKVKSFDDQVTVLVNIDPKYFKTIIGPGGTTLQGIVTAAGGPEDRRLANRMVQFPKPGSSDTAIRLQGTKAAVEKIQRAILAHAAEKDGQTTEIMVVPADKHRSLIGAGGSIRRKIDSDFNVEVNIPKPGEGEDVSITGKPEDVAKAKAHIEGLLKEQASETINVPRHLHYIVAEDGGQFFKRLRSDHGVNVDHGREKPPARSENKVNGKSAEPTAQKEDAPDGSHTWIVYHRLPPAAGDETDAIPWVLRGNSTRLPKARELILQAIADAQKPSSTGKLVLSDPKKYRFVIGPGGATVNNIRTKCGAQVTVPKQGTPGEHEGIEVKGTKDSVIQAKEMILEAIARGTENTGNGGPRRRRE
jgi:rRNA processing protein Krr1/Pno1